MPVLLAAEGVGMDAVTSAIVSGVSGIAESGMTTVGSVIPVALPIMGALVVVGIGIKVFKKVTGK